MESTSKAEWFGFSPPSDRPKWPYKYGSHLHWLWARVKLIDDGLVRDTICGEHSDILFKFGRLDSDAMIFFETRYGVSFKQIRKLHKRVVKAFAIHLADEHDEAKQTDYLDRLIFFKDRLLGQCEAISELPAFVQDQLDIDTEEPSVRETEQAAAISTTDELCPWMHVRDRLVEMRSGGEKFRSLRKFADHLGVSKNLVEKAFKKTVSLQAWRALSNNPAARATRLSDCVLDNVPAPTARSLDPETMSDVELHQKIEAMKVSASPEELKRLNGIPASDQLRLVREAGDYFTHEGGRWVFQIKGENPVEHKRA
jgi:hypothetical protein